MNSIGRLCLHQRFAPKLNNEFFVSVRCFQTGKLSLSRYDLNKDEVARYSPQLLCPGLGKQAQMNLKSSSVLIVGLGGRASTTAQYLTSAGIGKLGLVDTEKVKLNFLQRQTLYSKQNIGQSKVQSAIEKLKDLNENVNFDAHEIHLSRENALNIIEQYDIVVDGTQNPMAKYLINDACVLLKKPMITGSALRFDAYITVFNYDENSPCYRCALPRSMPASMTPKIADAGIFSPIMGMVGSIQAMETMKIAAGIKPIYNGFALTYSSLTGKFDVIQVDKRADDCEACGNKATLTKDLIDYDDFCGVEPVKPVKILSPEERITVQEYEKVLNSRKKHILIDVRPKNQQEIVKLDNAFTITLEEIVTGNGADLIQKLADRLIETAPDEDKHQIFVMCRRGVASQRGVREIQKRLKNSDCFEIKDIVGGIQSWAKEIDKEMPIY